jgi:hypothetical protein
VDWVWALSDPNGGADGSAMSKLFRGGALTDTSLLAREAIQNSSDAARQFALKHPGVPFKVVFRFVNLVGDEKEAAVEALGLAGLSERRKAYSKDPLQPGNALDQLDDPEVPLPLLYVEDYGTHGLFGATHIGLKSHLFKAMYYIGASDKAADAGGSYGFGKSALERASRTHSVIVHTAFEPFETDPVQTRLVGFTWWPNLQQDDELWNGRLSFSELHSEGSGSPVATPFEDGRANEVADALGFRARDPKNEAELGSSFLIIDPAIVAEELLEEIEKWWWPALEEHSLDVQVILPSGETRVPKPAGNPFVEQFLRAFRIATRLDEPGDPNVERLASEDWRDSNGLGGKDLGSLGLVVPDVAIDEEGEESETAPLVALMRGPRMVIQYLRFPRRRVPLRGVFVASDKIDGLLRETEPSSHDRWTENSAGDLPPAATETAKTVLGKIKSSVGKMASDITPTTPKNNRSLAHFSKLMSGFLGKKRGPKPPPGPGGEKIEILFPKGRPTPEVLGDNDVRVSTEFTVRVADDAPKATCEVSVTCYLFIHEDESQSQSKWPVQVAPVGAQSSFVLGEDGTWSGLLTQDDAVLFQVSSDPYPNLWTTSLQPNVTRIGGWNDK